MPMRLGFVARSLLFLAGLMLTTVSARARTIVYISNSDSKEIYVLELNEKTGVSTVLDKTPLPGAATASPMALSPDHKFLFVSLRSVPYSVSSFAIDPKTGKLTANKTTPLADNMAYITTDRTGKFLLAASYAGTKATINKISPEGEVDRVPLKVLETGAKTHSINTDLSNKFLYINNLGDDVIYQYKFNDMFGELIPNDPPKVETTKGTGPRHFAF